MLGLLVLIFFGVYLLISVTVTLVVASWARQDNRRPWLWGGIAAFIMYNLVFWDWLPTLAVHQYYCATEAGFWVYKTPEQWKAENPGVAEKLVATKMSPSTRTGNMDEYTNTYFINQQFNWVVKKHNVFIDGFHKLEQTIIDSKNNEVMARYIDFSTGYGNMMTARDTRAMKFWMANRHCPSGGWNHDAMGNLMTNFEQIGKRNDNHK